MSNEKVNEMIEKMNNQGYKVISDEEAMEILKKFALKGQPKPTASCNPLYMDDRLVTNKSQDSENKKE